MFRELNDNPQVYDDEWFSLLTIELPLEFLKDSGEIVIDSIHEVKSVFLSAGIQWLEAGTTGRVKSGRIKYQNQTATTLKVWMKLNIEIHYFILDKKPCMVKFEKEAIFHKKLIGEQQGIPDHPCPEMD
jgi:hypothetical protein